MSFSARNGGFRAADAQAPATENYDLGTPTENEPQSAQQMQEFFLQLQEQQSKFLVEFCTTLADKKSPTRKVTDVYDLKARVPAIKGGTDAQVYKELRSLQPILEPLGPSDRMAVLRKAVVPESDAARILERVTEDYDDESDRAAHFLSDLKLSVDLSPLRWDDIAWKDLLNVKYIDTGDLRADTQVYVATYAQMRDRIRKEKMHHTLQAFWHDENAATTLETKEEKERILGESTDRAAGNGFPSELRKEIKRHAACRYGRDATLGDLLKLIVEVGKEWRREKLTTSGKGSADDAFLLDHNATGSGAVTEDLDEETHTVDDADDEMIFLAADGTARFRPRTGKGKGKGAGKGVRTPAAVPMGPDGQPRFASLADRLNDSDARMDRIEKLLAKLVEQKM